MRSFSFFMTVTTALVLPPSFIMSSLESSSPQGPPTLGNEVMSNYSMNNIPRIMLKIYTSTP